MNENDGIPVVIGNLFDKKEIKRLKRMGLTLREIRNLRDQQTSGGKKKREVPISEVEIQEKNVIIKR